ncbi:hypothetical protein NQ317_017218 [Molorchus minor]|uniref:DUF4817 domain-containing protein n=1 Tax=Molorchus minor TaxID=1323400 RepID=A0ABQ9JVR5_9CUCU|nr:hypothetical protein NQ317_017218 [Molorchus minor]
MEHRSVILQIYYENNKNACAAQREYAQRFPDRPVPDRKTFRNIAERSEMKITKTETLTTLTSSYISKKIHTGCCQGSRNASVMCPEDIEKAQFFKIKDFKTKTKHFSFPEKIKRCVGWLLNKFGEDRAYIILLEMDQCGTCKLKISDDDKFISCDSCRVMLHLQEKCCTLSSTEIRAVVMQKRTLLFFCDECRTAFKNVPMLIRKIKDLDSEVDRLKHEVELLKNQNNSANIETMFMEINERMIRSNNLMIYNVPESTSNILDEKIIDDNLAVNDILKNLVLQNDSVQVQKVLVKLALKSKTKLYATNFRISQDHTKTQQNQYKTAKTELKTREDNGEQGLTIKYINGVPKVVHKRQTYTKKPLATPLLVYCQNAGGIRTKLKDLKLAISSSIYDIIILCETNVIKPIHDNVEQLFILCKYGNEEFIIGGVYIPPNSNLDVYTSHCQTVEMIGQIHPSHKLVLFGDYNLPEATWSNDDVGVSVNCPQGSAALYLAQWFGFLHLYQLNSIPNSRNVYLDLLFSHDNSIILNLAEDMLLPNSIHHYAYNFSIQINVTNKKYLNYEEFYYDFRNANYIGLNDYLASTDWEMYLNTRDVNEAVQKFYDYVYIGIAMFVPLKKFKTSNYPKWFTAELRHLVTDKKIAHRHYVTTKNDHDYLIFSQLRSRCKYLSKICYNNYTNTIDQSLLNNPKGFWKYLNDKRSTFNLPSEMFLDDCSTSNAKEIVDLFAKFFSTVYTTDNYDSHHNSNNSNHNLISLNNLSLIDIYNKISKIPSKLTAGPDGIPNLMLKMCICTLKSGVFPDLWKDSFIVPIYKSGDKSNIKNYRSICNQSSIPKMLDSLVYDQLFWSCKELIINQQHGFIRGRSTVTNLLVEYASMIWSPMYTVHTKTLERVQHKFLRYCGYKLNYPVINHNYDDLMKILNLPTLERRRIHADIIFIYKLLNGIIVCPDLLEIISFNVPNRLLRHYNTFHIRHHSTNYGKNSPYR